MRMRGGKGRASISQRNLHWLVTKGLHYRQEPESIFSQPEALSLTRVAPMDLAIIPLISKSGQGCGDGGREYKSQYDLDQHRHSLFVKT
jgi:hypothetical protein